MAPLPRPNPHWTTPIEVSIPPATPRRCSPRTRSTLRVVPQTRFRCISAELPREHGPPLQVATLTLTTDAL
jgi:hypothetical protein